MLFAQLLGLYLLNNVFGKGPRLAGVINGAGNWKWQQRKNSRSAPAWLRKSRGAELLQSLAYVPTRTRLNRALTLVKSGRAHADSPIGVLTMGKKRGSPSMRASQARNCG